MRPISFGSDNHSGVHPQIFASLAAVNSGTDASYEMDALSQELRKYFKSEMHAEAFLVFNGTAANVLSLSCATESFESILCSDISHLYVDECGAPEKFLGAKLMPVRSQNGKISAADLEAQLIRRGDQHFSQVKMVSITQPTEHGTVYSLAELDELKNFCRREKLLLHIDGARLGNAVYTLKSSFREIIAFADVVSLGGTKNGLLFGELVVIPNPRLAENFKFRRKQAMQLPSKTRFMAAAFLTYFQKDLWRDIAEHQCQLAQYLSEQLARLDIPSNYPVESNAVFCQIPREVIKALREEFFFYIWNEKTYECRLMTSFDTKKEDIDRFIKKIQNLKEVNNGKALPSR
jgi:threonine aldolase